MEPAAFTIVALLVGATVLGIVWRTTTGRARRADGSQSAVIEGVELGSRATLLQFSSEVCTPCRQTARVLSEFTDADAVAHVELDVALRPDLASRFNVLQTPTTLILDRAGAVRARIGGAARRDVVATELERVLA